MYLIQKRRAGGGGGGGHAMQNEALTLAYLLVLSSWINVHYEE